MARHQARRLKLHFRIAASASLVLALLAGLVGFAQNASAHSLSLGGVASCQEDGTFTITWTLSNDYQLDSIVHSFSTTPNVGTTHLTADASYHGGTPYNGAGTVVPANQSIQFTTTGIPGNTANVTLDVAGTWTDGFMQDNPPSATVQLAGDCNGTLKITKTVTGQSAPPANTNYTISYDNGTGTSGTVQVEAGQTVTVGNLPFGTYTLSEVSPPAGDKVTITPNPVTVSPDTKTADISVTNAFPDDGGFTVTKHVTGETAGYVPGSTFSVAYSCSNGASGTLSLVDGATKGVSALPIGTTCALSEGVKPPTTDPSYVYGTETWSPSNSLTIVANDDDNTVAVTLTNPITRVLGGFTVTKHVTGETAGYVPGSTFTVSYSCSDGTSGTLTLSDGTTKGVSALPIGTTCTLAETAKPATTDASYAWGAESWDPSNMVTVVANSTGNTVGVTLTNPLVRVLGGFTVTKHVTGETAGYVPGSTFTVSYSCSDGTSGTLTLSDGTTKGVSALPIGTTCTLAETAKPATTDASYAWGAESWDPSNMVTVVANSTGNTVGVTLTNPLVRVDGGFTVTKHVTGETAGYVPGSTFTVSYSCSDGTSGTLSLVDGTTKGVSALPIGTTCTLAETAKPATLDASYAWGAESWSPSSSLTIVVNTNGNTVGVTLTNPLVRVVGGFTVTKHVTGETAGYVPGSMFTVTFTCSDGTSGTLSLKDGDTSGVSNLPIGTTCTLSETGKPPTKDASYVYSPESWSPSNVVTIVVNDSGNTVGVTLTNPITRVEGGFTVTKHVTGETGGYVPDSTFTVSYSCSNGTSGTLTLADGDTKAVTGLPLLTTCSLAETAKPATTDASYAWGTESWDPSSTVTIVSNSANNVVGVVLTNPLVRVLGGFTVTKHVTGETAGYVPGSTFTVSFSCTDGTTGALTLKDGDTSGVNGLPIGTTCTLAETAKPATTDASYAWGTETWTPGHILTIVVNDSGNTVGVTLTNPLVRVLGGFTVTKHVTGETAGYVPGSTFTVSYSCSNDTSGTLTLIDGATSGVNGLPIGTSCTLAETAKPDTKDASYAWGPESWDPSSTVDIVVNDSGNTVGVTLTNPLVRVLGGFTVTKHVTGETAGYVPGSTFTVSFSCTDGTTGTLTLIDGATSGVNGLPIGTSCTLAETAKPDTKDASYAWGPESWDPSSTVVIVVNDSGNTVGVTLTNPLVRVLGGFTVTKHVTGETVGYVPGSTFTVSYSCSNDTSGTLTLVDGATSGVTGLPIGTSCSLSETAKPDTKDASYAWGPESWDPSSTVVIVVNDTQNTVGVVLTNPLVRVLGGFTVTKQVTGVTAGYVAGSTFTVSYTCSDGTTGQLVLSNGETKGVDALPIGTTCSLSETARPATASSSFTWGTPVWTPSNAVTIAANDTQNTVSVTLKNPLTQVLGESATPPATVQAATLPRTGAPDTIYLLVIGFMLLLGGGCFVAAAKIDGDK